MPHRKDKPILFQESGYKLHYVHQLFPDCGQTDTQLESGFCLSKMLSQKASTPSMSLAQIGPYSFDDEIITRFGYDDRRRRLELGFSGYYFESGYVDQPCTLLLTAWTSAKSKVYGTTTVEDLPAHISAFDMILQTTETASSLHMTVTTLDGQYLELQFESPTVAVLK